MPKFLFYAGTAFCLFLALTSGGGVARALRLGDLSFAALPAGPYAAWSIAAAFITGLAIAALFLRMAALLAARNLFAAFVGVLSVSGATIALAGVLFVQWRMVLGEAAAAPAIATALHLGEIHFAALMALGFFVSLSLLALRPYFNIQASRFLSALVLFPLPLFLLIVAQEMFVRPSEAPLPSSTPASLVFFAVLSVLFVSIAVHCIRHRHLFLEMTNLRELLDSRVDPARPGRPIGGVALNS